MENKQVIIFSIEEVETVDLNKMVSLFQKARNEFKSLQKYQFIFLNKAIKSIDKKELLKYLKN